MKVLKNNFNANQDDIKVEAYPKKFVCERCGSELEYEKTDIRISEFGCGALDCPLCGYENFPDGEGIDLTMDDIEFPAHFHHTSVDTGAVNCCNNERVRECIRKAINYLRANKKEYDWNYQSGNLYIHVHKWEGDEAYDIIVSNDFYSSSIMFESEDY